MTDAQGTESAKPGWPVLRETITNRNILIYVLSLGASKAGAWGTRIAVPLFAWELTSSPAWLGMIAFVTIAPALLFSPLGGVVADRIGLIRALRLTQTLQIMLSLVLFGFAFSGALTIYWLVSLVIFSSCVTALGWSSEFALMRVLASDRHLTAGVVLQELAGNFGRILGPLLVGLTATYVDSSFALLFGAIGYVAFLFGLSRLPMDLADDTVPKEKHPNLFFQISEVLKFIFHNQSLMILFACLVLGFMGVSGLSGEQIMSKLSQTRIGPAQFGIAMLVTGLAAMAILVVIALRGTVRNLTYFVSNSLLIGATAMLFLVVIQPVYFLILIGMVIFGSAQTVISTGARVLALRAFPAALLGRGMAMYIVVGYVGPALIVLAIGVLAEMASLSVIIGGLAGLLIVFWIWLRSRIPEMARELEGSPSGDTA